MINVTAHEINLEITKNAFNQVELIKENDYTIENLVFRLSIDGKGCSGFEYALGFTEPNETDLEVIVSDGERSMTIVIDKFAGYYCKSGVIDYILDIENDIEGFLFDNGNQKDYRGKFFKNESKVPEIVK